MGGLYHFPFTGYPTRKRVPMCQACERNLHSVVTIASRLRGRPVSLPQSTGVAIAPLPMDSKKFLRLIILLSPRKIEYHKPVYHSYLRLRYPCMPRKHAITGASTNKVTSPYQPNGLRGDHPESDTHSRLPLSCRNTIHYTHRLMCWRHIFNL